MTRKASRLRGLSLVLLGDILDLEAGRKRLLELLGLLGVLQDESVEVPLAADLELDLLGALVLLDARGRSIASPADLDELLDISDFLRHGGGCCGVPDWC